MNGIPPTRDPRLQAGHEGEQRPVRYPGPGVMLAICTALGCLTYARSAVFFQGVGFQGRVLPDLAGTIACYYPWAILSPLIFRLERKSPLGNRGWLRNAALLALVSIPICILASPMMLGLDFGVRSLLGGPSWFPNRLGFWFVHVPVAETLFWCSVAAGYFLRSLSQFHEQEREAARLALEKSQLETGLKEAQLEVLRSRLNPHFLFNSLQNISMMAEQDARAASRMMTLLGDVLRAALRGGSRPEVTLREEVEVARKYAAMEQMRFADRLTVTFRLEEEVQDALVPCFILQPLVENAIVHGLKDANREGVITISAHREVDDLILTVRDNGSGPAGEDLAHLKLGVGLGSTSERLERLYPGRHSFGLQRLPEGGTEVRIRAPFHLRGEAPMAR